MKRVFTISVVILFYNLALSQDKMVKGIWVDGSLALAVEPSPLKFGGSLSFNVLLKQNHTISFSYTPLSSRFYSTDRSGPPEIRSYNLTYGKLYYNKYLFANFRAGLGLVLYQDVLLRQNSGFTTYEVKDVHALGIPLEIKSGIKLGKIFKFIFTLYANINDPKPHFAALFGIGIGTFDL